MRRLFVVVFLLGLPLAALGEEPAAVSRREGFLLLWRSVHRPAVPVQEAPYPDVSPNDKGFTEITYAKARGILDPEEMFRPDDSLQLHQALVWLLRTRNVADPAAIQAATLSGTLLRYPIAPLPSDYLTSDFLMEEDLLALMRRLDALLAAEEHEVSLYAEKFHGKGTAFGETFDMNALTAAHRTYPQNTLVRVINIENGKSVVVRINDRGPFVPGRDMDLSLAAFTAIADRSQGKIRARFERLGDATLIDACSGSSVYQRRITRDVRLDPGIPHLFLLGQTLTLSATSPFVVRGVRYPDGFTTRMQDWVLTGEEFSLKPAAPGDYEFLLGTVSGRLRRMRMSVVECHRA